MVSGPVVAVGGTVAVMWLSSSMVMVVAVTPLNLTRVAPVKVVPVIVTVEPRIPVGVERLVILGVTLKVRAPPVPAGLVIWTGPVEAPGGTMALSWLLLTGVMVVAA